MLLFQLLGKDMGVTAHPACAAIFHSTELFWVKGKWSSVQVGDTFARPSPGELEQLNSNVIGSTTLFCRRDQILACFFWWTSGRIPKFDLAY